MHSAFEQDDDTLLAVTYENLRELASRLLAGERAGHTLQTTALVHEAWLRLGGPKHPDQHDRFLLLAARAMRRVLVDHARKRRRAKRGGGARPVPLLHPDEIGSGTALDPVDILALDAALEELRGSTPRQADVVELRFYGGLGAREVARVLETSERTIERDWALAKTFLRRRMGEAS